MVQDRSTTREVLSIKDGISEVVRRPVVSEVPLTIFLNGRELITLLTTGDANRELAVGFLLPHARWSCEVGPGVSRS